jgi:hypothetical protein
VPIRIITDKLRSYSAAKKELIPDVEHSTKQYENNRCELSHQLSRQQEMQKRKFKSQGHDLRFLLCHGVVNNLFRLSRHLMKSSHYRLIPDRSFVEWNRVGYVQNLAYLVKLPFKSSDPVNLTVPNCPLTDQFGMQINIYLIEYVSNTYCRTSSPLPPILDEN